MYFSVYTLNMDSRKLLESASWVIHAVNKAVYVPYKLPLWSAKVVYPQKREGFGKLRIYKPCSTTLYTAVTCHMKY